jgi:putative membrane protein
MRLVATLALLAGLAVAIALIAWRGVGTVAAAMASLGAGVLLLPLIYVPHIFGAATSWSLLFPAGRRPRFAVTLRAIWIGLAVEMLLPLAGLAAEVVKVRLLIRAGVRAADAASLAVVDLTVQVVVLIFWGVVGALALAGTGSDAGLVWPALGGAAVLAFAVSLLFYVQRGGFIGRFARFGARKLHSERWHGIADGAEHLDLVIREIYQRPLRVALAGALRCVTRSVMAVELWVAAWLMQHPISAADAAMFIGVVGTIRAIAFILPGGWGLQEGAYILLGHMIGVPPEVALALSLASRARELLVGVPALVAWQWSEGRGLRALAVRAEPSLATATDSEERRLR